LAHQIWEGEGQPEGKADEHWFRASAMIAEAKLEGDPDWLQKVAIAEEPEVEMKTNLAASIDEIKRKIGNRAAA